MDVEIEKKCTVCHETKPMSLFRKGIHRSGKRYTRNQCKGCHNNNIIIKEKRKKYAERSKKNKNLLTYIATTLISSSKTRTKQRNLMKENPGKVTITKKWILNKLKLGYCEGSSPPLKLVFDNPGSAFSPSLDRIDSSNYDYSPNNVRIVCKGINTARSNYNDQDILKITESLSGFIRKRRNSI